MQPVPINFRLTAAVANEIASLTDEASAGEQEPLVPVIGWHEEYEEVDRRLVEYGNFLGLVQKQSNSRKAYSNCRRRTGSFLTSSQSKRTNSTTVSSIFRMGGSSSFKRDVRYWPKADICSRSAHVCFRGQSRHDRLRESAFAVAIGGKADIAFCTAFV